MNLFCNQIAKMFERIFEVFGPTQHIGRNVLQNRFLVEIELDDIGDIGIDRFIVGNPCAHRVGDRNIAAAVYRQKTGNPQHRGRIEGQRIEKFVVDPAIDHVDPLRPLGGAHIDKPVTHKQIAPLYQLDSHLVGDKGMFEISTVIKTRRQHDDGRLIDGLGRRRAQIAQQIVGIVIDRRDRISGKDIGEQPHHHFAVFHHVGHARRRAQIVLKDIEILFADAHQIDPGNMGIDATGWIEIDHLRFIERIGQDQIDRNHPGLENLAIMIDVVQKLIDGAHALDGAFLEKAPFIGTEDMRNNVERDQPLGADFLAINDKGNPQPVKQQIRLIPLALNIFRRHLPQPVIECGDEIPRVALRSIPFVEDARSNGYVFRVDHLLML